MLKIGVLSPKNSTEIVEALISLIKSKNLLVAVKKNNPRIFSELSFFSECGIDFSIIVFEKSAVYPIDLDILILDNEYREQIVSYDLIRCIGEKTFLIYNTDNDTLPLIEHPNAIDYGYSAKSSVTISSIDYTDNEISFIISVQREFSGIYNNRLEIGEFLIKSKFIANVTNILPAVICCIVSDIIKYAVVKI